MFDKFDVIWKFWSLLIYFGRYYAGINDRKCDNN